MQTNKTFNIISKHKNDPIIQYINEMMTKNEYKLDKKNPSYVFILGGDGTFVSTIKKFYNKEVWIIPINTGNVGFYSFFNKNRLPKLRDIQNKSNYINPDVIKAKINKKEVYAINEIAINGVNTITCSININGHFYEQFKGSGLIVSTKTGSTGYCKSANGSIIFPNVDAFEIIELFPTLHAKKTTINSPIILNTKNTKVKINNFKSNNPISFVSDGQCVAALKEATLDLSIIKPKGFKLFFPIRDNSQCNGDYIDKLQKTFIKG